MGVSASRSHQWSGAVTGTPSLIVRLLPPMSLLNLETSEFFVVQYVIFLWLMITQTLSTDISNINHSNIGYGSPAWH